MKTNIHTRFFIMLIICLLCISCEDFLEISSPDHQIIREEVFSDDEIAQSALTGIYNRLISVAFSSGGAGSVTVLSGLSGHELESIRTTNLPYMEFQEHEINPDNTRNLSLWSSFYNIIYMTNAVLEGLNNSDGLTEDTINQISGEVSFIRAFSYFYLTNLYGNIPLILSTDYLNNETAANHTKTEIYTQIITDLENAQELLGSEYPDNERTRITSSSAKALLARVYLFLEDWEKAGSYSSELIGNNSTYEIPDDLNAVFLQNSREAIWQITPAGRGGSFTQTNEGGTFIMNDLSIPTVRLSDELAESYSEHDERRKQWIGFYEGRDSYFAYKYKDWNSRDNLTEYSMVLRLAEQYLIRAEARAKQGNLTGAIHDIDIIRSRAGLDLINDINPGISGEELFNVIMEERKKELFTEWGHRWLDLKRTSTTGQIAGDHSSREESDQWYPIPEQELLKNPNLTQNPGY